MWTNQWLQMLFVPCTSPFCFLLLGWLLCHQSICIARKRSWFVGDFFMTDLFIFWFWKPIESLKKGIHLFYISLTFYRCWVVWLHMWPKLLKFFCISRGSCVMPDKHPQVMSLKSALVRARLQVSKWKKTGVWRLKKKSDLTRLCDPC